jgi:hypothetical protein
MTLVQASIGDKGKCVILIADRMLTSRLSEGLPSYEFESTTPKIVHKGNVGVGFSGISLYIDLAISKIGNRTDFDEIVKTTSEFVKEIKNKNIDAYVKRLTGVGSENFFNSNDLPIPEEIRKHVYGQLKDFEGGCQAIVAGFDKKGKARIVIVDEQGDTFETTSFSAFSIGSGHPFSKIFFDQHSYDPIMVAPEALLFAYEAKQWAQSHTGVGSKTDILVFRKGKKVLGIYNDSKLQKELHGKYIQERQRHSEVRKSLLKDILNPTSRIKGGKNEVI